MSITVTTDVFCDYPHCGQWEHGTVGSTPNATGARRRVAPAGWRVRRFTNPAGLTVTVDLCPDHADVEVLPT